jgi:hypothetical protein
MNLSDEQTSLSDPNRQDESQRFADGHFLGKALAQTVRGDAVIRMVLPAIRSAQYSTRSLTPMLSTNVAVTVIVKWQKR